MERDSGASLVVENRAMLRPIDDGTFREWMSHRPIFVSSVMDDEMQSARDAVRSWILQWGGEPVMWEMLSPRDQHPERAYLEGVERSHICVLLLGTVYGVSDESGFSPTHKEVNHAAELHITRLLFQPAGLVQSERDGKLNRWVNSVYHEVAGGKYQNPEDLTTQLERQLREIVSAQETPWVKLDSMILPGAVRTHSSGGRTTITVTARVRQHAIRQGFSALSVSHRQRAIPLTWGTTSHRVDIEDIIIDSRTTSEDEVHITCHLAAGQHSSSPFGLGGITFQHRGRSIGPNEQAAMWIDSAVLGHQNKMDDGILERLVSPDRMSLPDVLAAQRAQGWLAEGIVRLYLVESLTDRFDARFEHIDVGPATANGVRIIARFLLPGFNSTPIEVEGVVPLR